MKTKQELKLYRRWYYENNREYYLKYQDRVREGRKRNCIYKIMSKDENIIILGSTTDIYARVANYWSDNTTILLKSNYKKYGYKCFEVCYLNDSINRTELYYIEDYLIKANETMLNENDAYNERNRSKLENEIISDDRKKELEEIAKELKFSIYEY